VSEAEGRLVVVVEAMAGMRLNSPIETQNLEIRAVLVQEEKVNKAHGAVTEEKQDGAEKEANDNYL
jgi:hypothetical protein